jgi:hypothetical protein
MLTKQDLLQIKKVTTEVVVASENRIKKDLRDEFNPRFKELGDGLRNEFSSQFKQLGDDLRNEFNPQFEKLGNDLRNEFNPQFTKINKNLREFKEETRINFNEVWGELRFIREALNATIHRFDKEIIAMKAGSL